MRNQVLWRKISRIIMLLAKSLDLSPEQAMEVFYNSRTCTMIRDERYGLHLMSDAYIVEDVLRELGKE